MPNIDVPQCQMLLSHRTQSFPGRMTSLCPSGLLGMETLGHLHPRISSQQKVT